MTDAQFLQTVGQGGVPLLIVYLESRRPTRLPQRIVLGVLLRPLVCMEYLDGCRVHVRGEPEPQAGVLKTGPAELTLQLWPAGRVA